MKYLFILGNHPALSVAEIVSRLGENKFDLVNQSVLVMETKIEIDPKKLIAQLGGTIKIAQVIDRVGKPNTKEILEKIQSKFMLQTGKIKFGISAYDLKPNFTHQLAMNIKKYLKEKGLSCRWVTSREKTLSSVVVEQNKLTSQGLEIILVKNNDQIIIAHTKAVQPFKDLSKRDYGRPARDDHSGMIPPKLAQIMINLARPEDNTTCCLQGTLLDPFCGSGTILTEALLLGYKNIIGIDNSRKAIEDTEKNIIWTKQQSGLANFIFDLYCHDASQLTQIIKPNSIDTIVTEPYLGPQRGKINFKQTISELNKLYSNALAEFTKVLKSSGRVVMIWPQFRMGTTSHKLQPKLNNLKIINPIPRALQNNKNIQLTNRQTLLYGRPNQRVWREIAVLKKL